jgi:hypothetical protein
MNFPLTENRASDDWANPIDTSGRANRALVRYPSATAHLLAFGLDAYGLPWSRGVGGRCGARASAAVRSAGRQRRFVWLGVFGVTSCAAMLLSIKPVVASGEWSSPVDQDHPGDLWPGSWPSVFSGVTPAAGPGVVVAVKSRAADHCVTGLRRQDETFGRLSPEQLVGMLG